MNIRTSVAMAALVLAMAVAAVAHGGRMGGKERMGDAHRASLTELLGLTEDQQAQLTTLRETYGERKQALREDKRAAVEAVLTPEQVATLETLRADAEGRRHGSKADALGLTPDQVAAIDALRESFHAQITDLRQARHAEFEAILTAEQLEIHGDAPFCKGGRRHGAGDGETPPDEEMTTTESALGLAEAAPTAVAETSWGALKTGMR
jgi:Spy/CpxP family protein refolding chaperone